MIRRKLKEGLLWNKANRNDEFRFGSWGNKQEVERPYKFGEKLRAGSELAGVEELC